MLTDFTIFLRIFELISLLAVGGQAAHYQVLTSATVWLARRRAHQHFRTLAFCVQAGFVHIICLLYGFRFACFFVAFSSPRLQIAISPVFVVATTGICWSLSFCRFQLAGEGYLHIYIFIQSTLYQL